MEKGIHQYFITANGQRLNYTDWVRLIQTSEAFILFFVEQLSSVDFEGFFWEVKPVTEDQLDLPFEFVLVESRLLPNIKANKTPFKTYLDQNQEALAVTFQNLGGDAQLIVPQEKTESDSYGHLAVFLRNASQKQIFAFWKLVGKVYEQAIGADPKWLSTAGLGVSWLHVRVDSRPKYYRFHAYKNR